MNLTDLGPRPFGSNSFCLLLCVAISGACDPGNDDGPSSAGAEGGAFPVGGAGVMSGGASGQPVAGNAGKVLGSGGGPGNGGVTSGGSGPGGSGQGGGPVGQGGTLGQGGTPANGGVVAEGGAGRGGSGEGGAGRGGSGEGGAGRGGSGEGGAGRGGSGEGGAGRGGAGRGGSGQGGDGEGGEGEGGEGTGGNQATSCELSGSPSPGNAAFTWYQLTQGSYVENGHYQTACGYHGQGQGQSPDAIQNIANSAHFVAIPGQDPNNFENVKYCGSCVELQGANGNKVIATVVDECPLSSNPICQRNGALDVSKGAFDQLGFSTGDPSGTTWKFVPCPVTGNIKVRIKPGNNNMIFIENTILGIQSVSMNGQQGSRTSYGCWQFGGAIPAGATLELTDNAGRKTSITVSHTNADQDQDTGKQLPACQ